MYVCMYVCMYVYIAIALETARGQSPRQSSCFVSVCCVVVVFCVVVVVVAVVGELGVSSVCRGGGGVFLLHVCLTCMFTCMPFTCMFTGCCA